VGFKVRLSLVALVVGVLVVVSAPAAQAAGELPRIEKFVATNCKVATCGEEEVETGFFEPKAKITEGEAKAEGFTEAGGRVPYGVTDFKMLTLPEYEGKPAKYSTDNVVPTSIVTHIRTDVAPGLATNPFAVERCTKAEFGEETIPGSTFFTEPKGKCLEAEIGTQDATVYGGPEPPAGFGDLALTGEVYDLVPEETEEMANHQKLAALYGVALELPTELTGFLLAKGFKEAEEKGAKPGVGGFPSLGAQAVLEAKQWYAHTLIKGNVEWGVEARGTGKGDYHDYFEIEVSPELPLIRSRLVFEGTAGPEGTFITNATNCPGVATGNLTTRLTVIDASKEPTEKEFTTPIGLECAGLKFEPAFKLTQGSTVSDAPDSLTTEVSIPQEAAREQSQVKSASFTLPEGMTLDPSAAYGLQDCTPAQAHINSEEFGTNCPDASKVGTVSLEVPTLPPGSLTGSVYLGGPESGPITGPPYTIYVVANSERYGVSVRLKGEVIPNETEGQVTTVFAPPLPEQPFTSIALHFDRGVLTSVANPLVCGTPTGKTSFAPTSTETSSANAAFGASVTGCSAPIPFALSQAAEGEIATGGGHTSFTYGLTRPEGDQYLKEVKTVLPAGLVGEIPDVTLCGEAAANAGTCGPASKIGTVSVAAGSGSSPYVFNGSMYMTGPYNGAPFGLSIVVPAVAGPFNLGNVISRATININPTTAQVTAVSSLPTIVGGIPIRLRSLSVNVNRQGFLLNPTNCTTPLRIESTLTSTTSTVQEGLYSPFPSASPLEGCSGLAFKPTFTASTSGKPSKANGASLVTTITQPAGQANIKSVFVTLPKQLPSRLTTLQKACLAKVFEANPLACAKEAPGSEVGTATAITPTLPVPMTGPVFLVSHGGEEFPALELVLEGDGVRVIVEGKTNIKKGITTTNFATTPDVPVSSITVNLPLGPHSALAANGNICAPTLTMPTIITGQNGKQIKQNTLISPTGCGVQIVGHRVVGNTVYLTIKTFAAGRISGGGSGLTSKFRSLNAASKATTLKIPLSSRGRSRRKPFKVKVRVGFVPKKGAHTSATVTVSFR
jgi:hypothetical protein